MLDPTKIEITAEYQQCFDNIDSGASLMMVSGKAGTGKSVFIELLKHKYTDKSITLLAPTGVAALNIGGQTMHRTFLIPPMFLTKAFARTHIKTLHSRGKGPIFDGIEIMVIDEISMVRADMVDFLDRVLKAMRHSNRPFGGIQVIMVGDVFQLPPIINQRAEGYDQYMADYDSEFFFSSELIKQQMMLDDLNVVILRKVFRQTDEIFISILNDIRTATNLKHNVHILNEVCYRDAIGRDTRNNIVLCTTNGTAQGINDDRLYELKTAEIQFKSSTAGTFDMSTVITPELLLLKEGARIMMTKNDVDDRYINGSLGTILEIIGTGTNAEIVINLDGDDHPTTIVRATWNNIVPRFNSTTQEVEEHTIGSYMQYPMMLAYAITIHKSQGLTFDKLSIDLGNGAFVGGQAYVALSRCTSIEGITLVKPMTIHDVIVNPTIIAFNNIIDPK